MSAAGADRKRALAAGARPAVPPGTAGRVRGFVSVRKDVIVLAVIAALGAASVLAFTYASRARARLTATSTTAAAAIPKGHAVPEAPAVVESLASQDQPRPQSQKESLPTVGPPARPVEAQRSQSTVVSGAEAGASEPPASLAETHNIPAEVADATDANVRASRLREIAESGSPESFQLLEHTLRSDSIARNRLLAVNSLRLLGKQGNAQRAREALRIAMSDADENVATSARDAYQELTR